MREKCRARKVPAALYHGHRHQPESFYSCHGQEHQCLQAGAVGYMMGFLLLAFAIQTRHSGHLYVY